MRTDRPLVAIRKQGLELITHVGRLAIFTPLTPEEAEDLGNWLLERAAEAKR